ncbi:hypothetical protein ALC62_12813 [Cyphomyrmex costatus]|uniref:Uncharacterized protein n=1 Tax=Cyphomyrmex costatus TaxID=456900 RepID=A0A151IAN5_9HYME|nr:hypothetical protein ALC62_12813 [Cyphomyrmex costatus]
MYSYTILNLDGIEFPMKFKDIEKFKRMNDEEQGVRRCAGSCSGCPAAENARQRQRAPDSLSSAGYRDRNIRDRKNKGCGGVQEAAAVVRRPRTPGRGRERPTPFRVLVIGTGIFEIGRTMGAEVCRKLQRLSGVRERPAEAENTLPPRFVGATRYVFGDLSVDGSSGGRERPAEAGYALAPRFVGMSRSWMSVSEYCEGADDSEVCGTAGDRQKGRVA